MKFPLAKDPKVINQLPSIVYECRSMGSAGERGGSQIVSLHSRHPSSRLAALSALNPPLFCGSVTGTEEQKGSVSTSRWVLLKYAIYLRLLLAVFLVCLHCFAFFPPSFNVEL